MLTLGYFQLIAINEIIYKQTALRKASKCCIDMKHNFIT